MSKSASSLARHASHSRTQHSAPLQQTCYVQGACSATVNEMVKNAKKSRGVLLDSVTIIVVWDLFATEGRRQANETTMIFTVLLSKLVSVNALKTARVLSWTNNGQLLRQGDSRGVCIQKAALHWEPPETHRFRFITNEGNDTFTQRTTLRDMALANGWRAGLWVGSCGCGASGASTAVSYVNQFFSLKSI